MSDLTDVRLEEFRERAELGVSMPDLAHLERRGGALRRRRTATAVGTLVLAVVAGLGVAGSFSGTPRTAPVPANPAPTPTTVSSGWDAEVRKVMQDNGEELLRAGRSSAIYGGLELSFDVPSDLRWEWAGAGAGLRRGEDPDVYATTVFWLPEPSVRLGDCLTKRAAPLGTDPDDLVGNVRPMLDAVSSTVLQEPRVVDAFGGKAAYLQLRTEGGCPPNGPLPGQFRGLANAKVMDPGWGGSHTLDAWHVVRGDESVLVLAWHLGGTAAQAAERQALVDSIRVTPVA